MDTSGNAEESDGVYLDGSSEDEEEELVESAEEDGQGLAQAESEYTASDDEVSTPAVAAATAAAPEFEPTDTGGDDQEWV